VRASVPVDIVTQDVLKSEIDNAWFESNNAELRRDKERLQKSIEKLERVQREHLSIMKHLVQDMLRSNVELTDLVRERLEHHAPGVLQKHSLQTAQHTPRQQQFGAYPYTPSPSTAPSAPGWHGRDVSMTSGWTPSFSNEPVQDQRMSGHPSLLYPAKRRRIDVPASDESQFSMAPESYDSTPRYTPMDFTSTDQQIDASDLEQAAVFFNKDMSGHALVDTWSPAKQLVANMPTQASETFVANQEHRNRTYMHEEACQRPASEPVRLVRLTNPPSIESRSSQHLGDIWEWSEATADTQLGYCMPDLNPQHSSQENGQPDASFIDRNFDTAMCDDWSLGDNGSTA
jgi:hypothetical protein